MLLVKHKLRTFLLIFIAASLGFLSFLWRSNTADKKVTSTNIPKYKVAAATVVTPTPAAETLISSPDGKKVLTMSKQQTANLTAYTFYTSDTSSNGKIFIFNQTKNSNEDITVPFNTWSPDNKYLFLAEATSNEKNYLVLNAAGKSFTDDSNYLNITELFKQKLPQFILEDVTGWAAPYLLIVNTKTAEGVEGPSFWFDLSSLSFIQLANRFN